MMSYEKDIKIELELENLDIINDVFQESKYLSIPDSNAKIQIVNAKSHNFFSESTIVSIIVSHFDNIALGIVSAWLYDKFFNGKSIVIKAKINGKLINSQKKKLIKEIEKAIINKKEK